MIMPGFVINFIIIPIIVLAFSSYGNFVTSDSELANFKFAVKDMFTFAYDNYMSLAYPEDELDPISCRGKSRNRKVYDQGLNDVLGDFMLTLVDSMDTLAVMGNHSEFSNAVQLVVDNLSFDTDNIIQVFEVNIRVLGSLLSSHLLAKYPMNGPAVKGYNDGLLNLAIDLADRLLPAFDTPTGIPYPRVNLKYGVPLESTSETCTAGGGTLILEFGVLSALTGNPKYEEKAKNALVALWNRRSKLNLFGNGIDAQTGAWTQPYSGIGAGIDSIFEYMLKAYILFEDDDYLIMFHQCYESIMAYMKDSHGDLFYTIDMTSGSIMTQWVDSLSAFFPGLLVLYGDIETAIRSHALYFHIWQKYGSLPERFDIVNKSPALLHYPLRPELIESTYFLYLATKDPFYLDAGKQFVTDFLEHTRTKCGFSCLGDVITKRKDERMETFFLSETLKYLYLLFDKGKSPVSCNEMQKQRVFTEAHIFYLPSQFRKVKPRSTVKSSFKICHLQYENKYPWSSVYFQVDHKRLNERVGNQKNYSIHVNYTKYHRGEEMEQKCPVFKFGSLLEKKRFKYSEFDDKDMIRVELTSSKRAHEEIKFVSISDILLFSHFNHTPVDFAVSLTDTSKKIEIDFSQIGSINSISKRAFVVESGSNDQTNYIMKKDVNMRYQPVLSTLSTDLDDTFWVLVQANYGPKMWPFQSLSDTEGVIFEGYPLLEHGCYYAPKDRKGYEQIRQIVQGKIMFVKRGSCFFSDKTKVAAYYGAMAVVVYNYEDNGLTWMVPSNTKENFSVPSFFLTINQYNQFINANCKYSDNFVTDRNVRTCNLKNLTISPGFDTSLILSDPEQSSLITKDLVGNLLLMTKETKSHDRLLFQHYVVRNAYGLHWPLVIFESFSRKSSPIWLHLQRRSEEIDLVKFCYEEYGAPTVSVCRSDGCPCSQCTKTTG